MASAILGIGVLVFLAHFFTALFKKTRLPDILLLMVLGVVLGPVLHLVAPEDFGKVGSVMSTLALIVILFESGAAMEPVTLGMSIKPAIGITFPTFLATTALTWAFSVHILGMSQMSGWITGAILGGVSVAVVIPLVKSINAGLVFSNTLILESALGDVLSIVLLLGLLQAVQAGALNPAKMVGSIMASLLMAGIIGVLGGLAWALVLNEVRQLPNSAFTTLAVVFILYGVADELGFSGAIAALAFGATLTNYDHLPIRRFAVFQQRQLGRLDEKDMAFFMEILFLLKTFFFVYMGASIGFQDAKLAGGALVLCLGIYVSRLIIVRLFARHPSFSWRELSLASILVPKGLVSAVLAGIAVDAGIENALLIRDFVYMVVFVSVCMTAVLIPLIDRKPLSGICRWIFSHAADPLPPSNVTTIRESA